MSTTRTIAWSASEGTGPLDDATPLVAGVEYEEPLDEFLPGTAGIEPVCGPLEAGPPGTGGMEPVWG
ncbi:hypothetical protein, partial [Nonomuraea cypriaca]|uniref:hypothetical protein n=1 Tax=Nonomuraea cypriaca TaxID=1187855 RepID=UPI001A9C9BA2